VFRALLLFVFLFVLVSPAQAQMKMTRTMPVPTVKVPETMPRPAFGFQGGLSLGQMEAVEGTSTDRHTFGGGIFFDLPVSRYFTISPEMLYLSKGAYAELPTGSTEFRFDFLEIPVLAKMHFMTGEFRPYVFAGPSVGIPLSKTSVAPDGTATNVDGGGMVDLSAQVGLGAEIDLGGNMGFVLSGRYIHGFVDQSMDASQTLYNRTFLFMAGFRIGL